MFFFLKKKKEIKEKKLWYKMVRALNIFLTLTHDDDDENDKFSRENY
jgi:hypothetical protein